MRVHPAPPVAALAARCRSRGAPLAHPDGATAQRDFRYGLNGHGTGPQVNFIRASTAWASVDGTNVLVEAALNAARTHSDHGLLVEPTVTNKCANFNANPDAGLTNLTRAGDAAATLARTPDATRLGSAGLAGICASGYVFRLDNTAGTGEAWVTVAGATGNTTDHTVSAYVRGSGNVSVELSGAAGAAVALSGEYVRRSATLTPATAADTFKLRVSAGSVCYFVLNQCEAHAAATSPIVTAGSATLRYADYATASRAGVIADEGTVVMELTPGATGIDLGRPFGTYPTGGSSGVYLAVSGTTVTLQGWEAGALQFNLSMAGVGGGPNRVAMAWRPGHAQGALNGTVSATDSAVLDMDHRAAFAIGTRGDASFPFFGWIRAFAIYPRALESIELAGVTA